MVDSDHRVRYTAVADFSNLVKEAAKARAAMKALAADQEKLSKAQHAGDLQLADDLKKRNQALEQAGRAQRAHSNAVAKDNNAVAQQIKQLATLRKELERIERSGQQNIKVNVDASAFDSFNNKKKDSITRVKILVNDNEVTQAMVKLALLRREIDALNKYKVKISVDSSQVTEARKKITDVQNAHARASKLTSKVKVDTQDLDTAARKLTVLQRAFQLFGASAGGNGTSNSLRQTSRTVNVLVANLGRLVGVFFNVVTGFTLLASGIGPLISLLTSLGGVVLVAGNALGGLGAVAAALPGIFFAAAGGIASVVIAIQPVLAAFKAYTAQQKAMDSAASTSASTQRSSARAIESAARGVVTAERGIATAQLAAKRAQDSLNQARKDAIRNLQDLQREVAHAANDEQGARLALARAEQELQTQQNEGTASHLDRAEAVLAVREAELSLEDVLARNARNAEDLADANKKGVEGSDQVVSAQQAIEDANQRVADSQYELIQSQQQLADAQLDAVESANAVTKATDQYQKALDKLSPSGRAVVEGLLSMKAAWTELQQNVGESFFAPVVGQLGNLEKILPGLNTFLTDTGRAMGVVTARGIELVSSGPFQKDFATLGRASSRVISDFGTATLSLVDGFKELAVAAIPFTNFITSGIRDAATSFRDWAAAGRETGSIARALENAQQKIQSVVDTGKNLGRTFAEWFRAAEPLTDWLLPALERVSERWLYIAQNQDTAFGPLQTFLRDVKPLLSSAAQLIGDLARGIGSIGSNTDNINSAKSILDALRVNVLPPLIALINKMGQSGALGDAVKAFGHLLDAIRPITDVILTLIEGFANVIEKIPTQAVFGLVSVLILLKTAIAIGGVVGAAARALDAFGASALFVEKSTKTMSRALGAIGIVLLGVSLLIGAFGDDNEDAAKKVEANKSGIAELNDTLRENMGLVTEKARQQAAQLLQEKKLLDVGKDIGVAQSDVISGVLGEGDARTKVQTALNANVEARQAEYDLILKSRQNPNDPNAASRAEFVAAYERLKLSKEQRDAFNNLTEEQKKNLTSTEDIEKAVRNQTAAQKAQVEQHKLFLETTQDLTSEQKSLAQSLADVGSSFTTAGEKANGLRTAYDLLFGAAIDANEANENFHKSMLALPEALKNTDDALDINTEAGLQNRDAIQAVARASVEQAAADVAAGVPLAKATEDHHKRIDALKESARVAGIDTTATADMVAMYGTVPTDVTTEFAQKNASVITDAFDKILEDVQYLIKNGYLPPAQSVGRATGDLAYGYAYGGFVSGPGTNTSDSIHAMLSDGEFVQQASAVDYYGPAFMDALNKKQIPKDKIPKFAEGGVLQRPSRQSPGTVLNKQTNPVKQQLNSALMDLSIDFTAVPLALVRRLIMEKLKERKEKLGHYAKGGLVGRRGFASGGLVKSQSQSPAAAVSSGPVTSNAVIPSSSDGVVAAAVLPSVDAVTTQAADILGVMEQFKLDMLTVNQATSDLVLSLWTANAAQMLAITTGSTTSTLQLTQQSHTDMLSSWTTFSDLVIQTATNMSVKVQDIFSTAVNASKSIWDGIKPAIGDPVNVVINSILNAGLIAGFNKIAGYVKLDGIGALEPAKFADGGRIRGPGGPKADIIPIMASAGEFMQPAAAVDYYGPAMMEAIRQRKFPKFAEGGAVTAEGPGADSALSWMQGQTFSDYLGDAQARTDAIFSQIIANMDDSLGGFPLGESLAKLPPMLAGGLSAAIVEAAKSLSPPTGHGAATTESTWMNMWGVISSQFPDATMNSGLRFTDDGYHSKGQAIDIGSSKGEAGMHDIATWIAKNFPDSTQMIHQPVPPANILNGQLFDYGAATNADHYDHVHWAMAFKDIVAGLAASGMPEWPGGWGSFGQTSSAVDYNATAGVEQWRAIALAALSWTGQSQENITSLLRRMQQESGGNPNAINNWDINAQNGMPSQGLMQVIPPTFAMYRDPRLSSNILDPMANIVASINYTLSRYGNLQAGWNQPGGYADGGLIKLGKMHTGGHVTKVPAAAYDGPSDPWHTGADAPILGVGKRYSPRGYYKGDTYMWSGNRTSANPTLGNPLATMNHDELLKILQEGEFVVQKDAVNQPGGTELLEALNSGNLSAASVMAAVMDLNATTGANNGNFPYGGVAPGTGTLPTGDINWEDYFAPKPVPSPSEPGHGHSGHHRHRDRDRWGRGRKRWGHKALGGPIGRMHRGGKVRMSSLYGGLGDLSRAASGMSMGMSAAPDMGWRGDTVSSEVNNNNGRSMTMGDVYINNPKQEKSSVSLRRQLEIFARVNDLVPEGRR